MSGVNEGISTDIINRARYPRLRGMVDALMALPSVDMYYCERHATYWDPAQGQFAALPAGYVCGSGDNKNSVGARMMQRADGSVAAAAAPAA